MTSRLTQHYFPLAAIGLAVMSLGACDRIPNDPQRTEALVRDTGVIRLGWVDGAEPDQAAVKALQTLSFSTSARIERHEGESEEILRDLAEGKLDLVYGHFSDSNPWSKEVHFGTALGWRAKPPKVVRTPRFAMRNGENGWIMQVEAASRP